MDIRVKPGTHAAAYFHVVRRRKPPAVGDVIECYPAGAGDGCGYGSGSYGSRHQPSRWLVDEITFPMGPDGEPFYWLARY